MKAKINIFLHMPGKYKLFCIINFFLCGIARAIINILPLRHLKIYFGKFHKTLTLSTIISDQQRDHAIMIGRTVRIAAKYTPWNSSCLTQAMVAKFWCKYYRIPYVFYIGIARSPEAVSGYMVHAWITAGPINITGGNGLLDYNVISSYVYFVDMVSGYA